MMTDFATSSVEEFKKQAKAFHKKRPFLTKLAAYIILSQYPIPEIETSPRFSAHCIQREIESWTLDVDGFFYLCDDRDSKEVLFKHHPTIFQVAAFLSSDRRTTSRIIDIDEIIEAVRLVNVWSKKEVLND